MSIDTAPLPRVGAMLRVVSNWVRDQVYDAVVDAGFDDLNPAHVQLFRYPGLDGMRPTQVADELQITKQAVALLAGHLEENGYITREPDPDDGRVRVIRLTPEGRRVETTIHRHARLAERRIESILGPRDFERFETGLTTLFRAVTQED